MSDYRQKAFDALRKFEVNLQSECELYEAIAVLPPTKKRFWGFNGIAMRLKRSVPEVRLSWLLTKKGRICLAPPDSRSQHDPFSVQDVYEDSGVAEQGSVRLRAPSGTCRRVSV